MQKEKKWTEAIRCYHLLVSPAEQRHVVVAVVEFQKVRQSAGTKKAIPQGQHGYCSHSKTSLLQHHEQSRSSCIFHVERKHSRQTRKVRTEVRDDDSQ